PPLLNPIYGRMDHRRFGAGRRTDDEEASWQNALHAVHDCQCALLVGEIILSENIHSPDHMGWLREWIEDVPLGELEAVTSSDWVERIPAEYWELDDFVTIDVDGLERPEACLRDLTQRRSRPRQEPSTEHGLQRSVDGIRDRLRQGAGQNKLPENVLHFMTEFVEHDRYGPSSTAHRNDVTVAIARDEAYVEEPP